MHPTSGDTMMDAKRLMDVVFSVLLLVVLAPVMAGLSIWLLCRQGRPIFHISDRMCSPQRRFGLIKFRTMKVTAGRDQILGGYAFRDVTPTGRWMRKSRLDELPQLWNILKGDLSFVGPRPVLPEYVEAFPDLYNDVLSVKPGVTGLATLAYKERESVLLASCTSADVTHDMYVRRCIPQKARLDRHYIRTRTLLRDVLLVFQTIGELVRRN